MHFNPDPQRFPFIEFDLKSLNTEGDMDQSAYFLTSECAEKKNFK